MEPGLWGDPLTIVLVVYRMRGNLEESKQTSSIAPIYIYITKLPRRLWHEISLRQSSPSWGNDEPRHEDPPY